MRFGSSTTAAATTGPAKGPLPASSQPATGQMPFFKARRSRRKLGLSLGSLSGSRGAAAAVRLTAGLAGALPLAGLCLLLRFAVAAMARISCARGLQSQRRAAAAGENRGLGARLAAE